MEGWGKLNSPSEMKQEPEPGLNQVSGLQLPSSGHLQRRAREVGKWLQSPVQGREWTVMGKRMQDLADSERGGSSRAGSGEAFDPEPGKQSSS